MLEAQRKPLTVKQIMKREQEDEDTREGSQTSHMLQDTQCAAHPHNTISSTGATLPQSGTPREPQQMFHHEATPNGVGRRSIAKR